MGTKRHSSAAGFRELLEHSSAGAFIVQDGSLIYANPCFAAIFGRDRAKIIGQPLSSLVVGEDVPRLRRWLKSRLAVGSPDRPIGFRGMRVDGGVVHLEASATVVEIAGAAALAGTLLDVTSRVQAEEAQREIEERFALVMQATSNVILDWDLGSNEIRWNEMLHTAFCYDSGEAAGTYQWWAERIHPDDQRQVLTSVQQALAQDSQLWTSEYRFRRGDGTYATVLGRAFIVRTDSGVPVRVIGAMADVTEHRQLEERFYLSQRMEAIGRLAGGVAHDFNNVLMVIQATTDLVLSVPDLSTSVRADLGVIRKAAERATALTRQLLAFGRRQVLRPEVVDLNATISGMEGMLHRIIGEDIQMVTELRPGLDRVRVDPRQFEQVVLNLVANARDGMPHGGQLTISTDDVYLSEEQTETFTYPVLPGKYVRVSVKDTGMGMDAATLTQIFEPFFTTKPKGKGTGLGLSTAYGIIKQSGGYIWVTSEPGSGAAFDIYLPRTEASLLTAPVETEPARPPRGSGTVLLVEDEEAVRSVTRRILESGGYTVLEAESGAKALELCARHGAEIKALLTDVVMPEMSGPELASRVVDEFPGVQVLYMSGHTDDRMVQHGLGRQRVNFIQKPFQASSLLHRMQSLLTASR